MYMNSLEARAYINELSNKKQAFVFIVDYAMKHAHVWRVADIPNDVLVSFPHFSNAPQFIPSKHISLESIPISKSEYAKSFWCVQSHIQKGNSFLVNLTAESKIVTEASLFDIFSSAYAPYKLLFKNDFVVFSPEPFISIYKNCIRTFPMKGTIDAYIPDAKEQILSNKKEQAEHATIVDLLRNDLSLVAHNVQVTNYRYVEQINTQSHALLQVSSSIEGVLNHDIQNKLGDVIFSMLPAGSISGAPKLKTLEIISEAETYSRGFYTGVMGYFDGENMESAVMIRFIEQKNGSLYYKSGGGITSQSSIDEEYSELIQKIYVPIH